MAVESLQPRQLGIADLELDEPSVDEREQPVGLTVADVVEHEGGAQRVPLVERHFRIRERDSQQGPLQLIGPGWACSCDLVVGERPRSIRRAVSFGSACAANPAWTRRRPRWAYSRVTSAWARSEKPDGPGS